MMCNRSKQAAAPIASSGCFTLFHNIQREAMLQLHTGRTQNGSHRASSSSLLPDHFTHIALCDAQPYYRAIAVFQRLDNHALRLVHQSASHLSHEFRHILCRVVSCRELHGLGHQTRTSWESRCGAHTKPLRLVYCEIFQDIAGTSDTSSLDKLEPKPKALPLCIVGQKS